MGWFRLLKPCYTVSPFSVFYWLEWTIEYSSGEILSEEVKLHSLVVHIISDLTSGFLSVGDWPGCYCSIFHDLLNLPSISPIPILFVSLGLPGERHQDYTFFFIQTHVLMSKLERTQVLVHPSRWVCIVSVLIYFISINLENRLAHEMTSSIISLNIGVAQSTYAVPTKTRKLIPVRNVNVIYYLMINFISKFSNNMTFILHKILSYSN